MKIDHEIDSVEQRLARRRMSIDLTARAAARRSVDALVSPVGLAAAAGLGFVAARLVGGRSRRSERKQAKPARAYGMASLLASGVFALMRAQFGSPLQMAQLALSKYQASKRDAKSPAHDSRPAQARY